MNTLQKSNLVNDVALQGMTAEREKPGARSPTIKKVDFSLTASPGGAERGFTYHGCSLLEQQIERDLQTLVYVFQRSCSMKDVVALVLGGAYGRGEAGFCIDAKGRERLTVPYHIFVIVKDVSVFKQSYFNQVLAALRQRLKQKLKSGVRFSKVIPVSTLYDVPQQTDWYELKWGHRVLWGDLRVMSKIPFSKGKVFPCDEALRLLLKQGISLVRAQRQFKRQRRQKDVHYASLWRELCQTLLSCGSAYLILINEYTPTALEKLRKLRTLEQEDAFLNNNKFSQKYWQALQYIFKAHSTPTLADIQRILTETLLIYEKFYFKAFSIYTRRSVLDDRTFARSIKHYPITSQLYGTDKSIRHMCQNFFLMGLGGLSGVWRSYHPSYRLYAAVLGILLNNVPDRGILVRVAGEALGVSRQRYDASRTLAFLRLWKNL